MAVLEALVIRKVRLVALYCTVCVGGHLPGTKFDAICSRIQPDTGLSVGSLTFSHQRIHLPAFAALSLLTQAIFSAWHFRPAVCYIGARRRLFLDHIVNYCAASSAEICC